MCWLFLVDKFCVLFFKFYERSVATAVDEKLSLIHI